MSIAMTLVVIAVMAIVMAIVFTMLVVSERAKNSAVNDPDAIVYDGILALFHEERDNWTMRVSHIATVMKNRVRYIYELPAGKHTSRLRVNVEVAKKDAGLANGIVTVEIKQRTFTPRGEYQTFFREACTALDHYKMLKQIAPPSDEPDYLTTDDLNTKKIFKRKYDAGLF